MRYLGLLLIAALGCYVSAASPDSAHDKDDKAETKQTDGPTILEDPLLHLGFAWKDVSAWTKQAAKNVKAELDKVDLGETGKQVSHAGTSISSWVNEAAKDVKAETDKIDLTGANEWIRDSASAIQDALNKENATGFEKWVSQVSTGIGLEAALEDLKYITLEDVPAETWQYIQDNPGQTAFYVVEGVALIAPGALFGPLLKVAGFGGVGHRARMSMLTKRVVRREQLKINRYGCYYSTADVRTRGARWRMARHIDQRWRWEVWKSGTRPDD